ELDPGFDGEGVEEVVRGSRIDQSRHCNVGLRFCATEPGGRAEPRRGTSGGNDVIIGSVIAVPGAIEGPLAALFFEAIVEEWLVCEDGLCVGSVRVRDGQERLFAPFGQRTRADLTAK